MEPIRIYYEDFEPEDNNNSVNYAGKKRNPEQQRNTEKEKKNDPEEIQPSALIRLFPYADCGEKENYFRELEKRYTADRMDFYGLDYHAPEMIPAAERFQNTIEELCKAARNLFDESDGGAGQMTALDIMTRICKDCYVMEEEVSKHTKMMMESYPDDEILCEDMEDIAESLLDFSLKVYHTMMKYKHKGISENKTETA